MKALKVVHCVVVEDVYHCCLKNAAVLTKEKRYADSAKLDTHLHSGELNNDGGRRILVDYTG